jgi:hypothetical protein
LVKVHSGHQDQRSVSLKVLPNVPYGARCVPLGADVGVVLAPVSGSSGLVGHQSPALCEGLDVDLGVPAEDAFDLLEVGLELGEGDDGLLGVGPAAFMLRTSSAEATEVAISDDAGACGAALATGVGGELDGGLGDGASAGHGGDFLKGD